MKLGRVLALWMEWRGTLLFVLLMCAFRSSLADIHSVPTGSMNPTVMEGDRILMEKIAYDLRMPFTPLVLWHRADPMRGDIVVLHSPEDGMRLLKRVVTVPGDVVAMRDETLIIDGEALHYAGPTPGEGAALPHASAYVFEQEDLAGHGHAVMFDPGRPALRDFAPLTVPPSQYFVMGDNRDDSKDSRYIGFIPRAAIAGRAFAVGYSLDPARHYLPRLSRSFKTLY